MPRDYKYECKRCGFKYASEHKLKGFAKMCPKCQKFMSLVEISHPAHHKREVLADFMHKEWSGWMEYLFSKCKEEKVLEDLGAGGSVLSRTGALVIPKEFVDRWKRQMETPYKGLSYKEKESDRKEADKLLRILENHKEGEK